MRPNPDSKIGRVLAMVRERGGSVSSPDLIRLCGSVCDDKSTTLALRAELTKRGFTETRVVLTEKGMQ